LQFCQEELLQDLTSRQMWPENMVCIFHMLSYLHLMSLNNLPDAFLYRYWTSIAVIITLHIWTI